MAADPLSTRTIEVYRSFIMAFNRKDLDAAARLVNRPRNRENRVEFSPGFVGCEEAMTSIWQVCKGLRNLRVELHNVLATRDVALARGAIRRNATGCLYCVHAIKRSFEASFFDDVLRDGGLIVERVQQADVRGQMRQLYGKAPSRNLAATAWPIPLVLPVTRTRLPSNSRETTMSPGEAIVVPPANLLGPR